MRFGRRLLEQNPTGGGGTPPTPPTQQGVPAPPSNNPIATNVASAVAQAGGDKDKAIRLLLRENHRYRERHRADETTIAQLNTRLVPEGGLALTKEQKEKWEKIVALGNVDEVIANFPKGQEALSKLSTIEKKSTIATIAALAGVNPDVLADLAESKGLTFETRDEVVDGQAVKVPFVKGNEKDAAFEKLATYIDSKLAPYKPALTADAAQGSTGQGLGAPRNNVPTGGTSFPTSAPSGGNPPRGGDAVENFIAKRNENAAKRPNPLVKSA